MLIGTALFIFYQTTGNVLPEGIKADAVFPHFIGVELPVGVTGLVVAALAAAAISSLDSDMNCLAAITVEDYYVRFKPNSTDKQRLRLGRWVVFITGVASIGIAMLYVVWGGEGVLGAVFSLYAIFSAGIVGIFLLGLFSRRANRQGLYIGIAVADATDAARSASDIVLTEPGLSVIISAVLTSRAIFQRMKNYTVSHSPSSVSIFFLYHAVYLLFVT